MLKRLLMIAILVVPSSGLAVGASDFGPATSNLSVSDPNTAAMLQPAGTDSLQPTSTGISQAPSDSSQTLQVTTDQSAIASYLKGEMTASPQKPAENNTQLWWVASSLIILISTIGAYIYLIQRGRGQLSKR